MFAIRSTPRLAAIAAAGACLMLSGCGGGSTGGSTAGSSSGGTAAASSSSGPALSGLPSAKLTGHFCKDFSNISHNLPKVSAADKNNLAALQANGGQFFTSAAAYFNGLAAEAPPQAAAQLKIIAAAYTSLASGSISASSVKQVEKQMESITTSGKTGQAFIGLVTYLTTHCH